MWPIFLNSVNAKGEKYKEFIASKLECCIKEVKLQNVIQIITNNASTCKGVVAIIEGKYPHIL